MQTKFHLPQPYVARLTAFAPGGSVFINGSRAFVVYDYYVPHSAELSEALDYAPFNWMLIESNKVTVLIRQPETTLVVPASADTPEGIQTLHNHFEVLELSEDDIAAAQYIALTE